AETEEFGLEAGRVGETDSVKLLTVHASKGLEWPVVIVPGLSYVPRKDGGPAKGSIFPSPPQNATRWTANPRVLPFMLRGDRADLPALNGLEKDDLAAFDRACAERDLREERRLAYVAVTRASSLLIATGYWWGSSGRPLGPSPFLEEVREVCLAGGGAGPGRGPAPGGPTRRRRAPPTRCWTTPTRRSGPWRPATAAAPPSRRASGTRPWSRRPAWSRTRWPGGRGTGRGTRACRT